MRDWKKFWNSIDTNEGKNNDWRSMMAQVGKTVKREPIDQNQFDKTYKKIIDILSLGENDTVLDLCCGNGIITKKISEYVETIIGVDFSSPLINVANATKNDNIHYFCSSVIDVSLPEVLNNRKFTKLYMNTALQHFSENDFDKLINNYLSLSASESAFFITDIPDKKNLFAFYDTKERKNEYYKRVADGTEAIGTWWERDVLVNKVMAKGLYIQTLDQAPDFYTSHYRFDILIYNGLTNNLISQKR
jgi:2-polyprenyl-3-methyl-5-hydroxy-6-metoxy-1,4-benzoquinol methylase